MPKSLERRIAQRSAIWGSENGTFVGGERIKVLRDIRAGDRITLGPFDFVWTGDRLRPIHVQIRASGELLQSQAQLSCKQLTRRLSQNGDLLLSDISLSFSPGKFTCILGPSGSGKSTLVKALSHREIPDNRLIRTGNVLINSLSLDENFDQLKHHIAYVPQHEIVFDDLNVETALYFTAKLRLPKDTTRSEVSERIDQVLAMVQLSDCRQKPISKLSGGQRKRVALANEILAEPSILFVDEVTSGLDEMVDSEMMRLFRQIADSGKSVVCVTHTVANVPRDCHEVVALTRFGRLAFRGTPAACIDFFGVEKLSDVYQRLNVRLPEEADHLAREFQRSSAGIDDSHTETVQPGLFGQKTNHALDRRILPKIDLRFSMQQFSVIFQRGILRTALDGKSNVLRLLQVVVVAILLISVFGDLAQDPVGQRNCCFIVVLSCFWFGCNNAAKEIVRERPIFEQERSVVLLPLSYVCGKLSVLSTFTVSQGIALMLLVHHWCELPGEPIAWCLIAIATVMSGTTLGLAISAASRNQDVAVSAVPIVLIPQIILAGAVASLEGMNEWTAKLAISAYWGLDASSMLLQGTEPWKWEGGIVCPNFAILGQAILSFVLAFCSLRKKH
ncbi:MAG: ATP-binding cassette domain-containing protein [Pirellulaceae bacterium]